MIEGIDLSRANGTRVSLADARDSGIEIAYFKATEGQGYEDPMLAELCALARTGGTMRFGLYHYLHVRTGLQDAAAQADEFCRRHERESPTEDPILDCERGLNEGANGAQWFEAVTTFLARVECLTGRMCGIYTNASSWGRFPELNVPAFAMTRLWVAHFTDAPAPLVPAPWGPDDWAGWQYSATGAIPGVTGHVDRSRWK